MKTIVELLKKDTDSSRESEGDFKVEEMLIESGSTVWVRDKVRKWKLGAQTKNWSKSNTHPQLDTKRRGSFCYWREVLQWSIYGIEKFVDKIQEASEIFQGRAVKEEEASPNELRREIVHKVPVNKLLIGTVFRQLNQQFQLWSLMRFIEKMGWDCRLGKT